MPAETWETEIFPARVHPYQTEALDRMLRETELGWIGGNGRKVAFYFDPDLDLLHGEHALSGTQDSQDTDPAANNSASVDPAGPKGLFPDPMGRYDFSTMLRTSGSSPGDLVHYLWRNVWEGRVSNDTFSVIRKGIEHQFEPEAALSESAKRPRRTHGMGRRSGFHAGKAPCPWQAPGFEFRTPTWRAIRWNPRNATKSVCACCWTGMGSCSGNSC